VLAVSHGAAMGLALGHLLDGNATAWRNYHHSNCGVSELVLEPTPRLVAFDTTDHLQDEA